VKKDGTLSDTFEEAFSGSEAAATAVIKATMLVTAAAKQMQKAAREGDIGKLQKLAEQIVSANDNSRQAVANAKSSWPFSPEDAQEYLSSAYESELIAEANKIGLTIYSSDGRLLAYPSILQVLPRDLSVRIDRKKSSGIRPSQLAKALLANQSKKPNFAIAPFIEAVYNAYKILVGKDSSNPVIHLEDIYRVFTALPGIAREYGKADLARDIFMLDRHNAMETKDGSWLTLPASTSIKGGAKSAFTFVSPEGEVMTYNGIRFSREDH
jgi:hypothetical protein